MSRKKREVFINVKEKGRKTKSFRVKSEYAVAWFTHVLKQLVRDGGLGDVEEEWATRKDK